MTVTHDISAADYERILEAYLRFHSEDALYQASVLSQACIESGLGPEDIIALHFDALAELLKSRSHHDQARATGDAQQFLLEVMITYGVKFKEFLELKLRETMRDAESRAARERERAVEAERLQREKDEILAAIAHELRTPITTVKGNLDMVTRSLNKGSTKPVGEYIRHAREAIDRLSRLSADLVEASRGDLPPLAVKRLDLTVVLDQAVRWVLPAASAKGIKVQVPSGSEPLWAMGDADGLLTVFGNLLSNAVRYTNAGGTVSVLSDTHGDTLSITIQDTGIGMSPDTQARIFDKFFRAPEARIMEAKGLGLGLSLVQHMVQAHGGRIEVQSAIAQGSKFTVVLPLAQE
ncbi:MAG TPA: ATP-binding protein [Chloroflexota bacterium]